MTSELPPLSAGVSVCTSKDTALVSVQLTEPGGEPITWRAAAFAYLSENPEGATLVTGMARPWKAVRGAVVPIVPNRAGIIITDEAGRLEVEIPLTYRPRYLVTVLPTGRLMVSGELAREQP